MKHLMVTCLFAIVASAALADSTLTNYSSREYEQELVYLKDAPPGAAGTFVVKEDGKPVPYEIVEVDGRPRVWLMTGFTAGGKHAYTIESGTPAPAVPKVAVRREGANYLLDNGQIAVRVPAEQPAGQAGEIPGPIAGVKLDGRWVAGSFWHTGRKLKALNATVLGEGKVLGMVRLRYEFEGKAGYRGDIDAFAEIDVTLAPGWRHAEIAERHEMSRGDYWELVASKGWSPKQGNAKPFSGGAGSGDVAGKTQPQRELKPGGLPLQRDDLYINLLPRWNQHYKDGWYFTTTDGTGHLGAVVVRASRWVWPHQNAIEAVVKPGGDYAGLRCPTWKGRRLWWLVNSTVPCDAGYVRRFAWETIDKQNHEMILDWPGQDKPGLFGMNFYDHGQIDPTGTMRGQGRAAVAAAGKPGNRDVLSKMQMMIHGDGYGSYYNFWSPENPNFFTDYNRVPIALTAQLKNHPRFKELAAQAEAKLREDVDHSVTLPSGAGQECPGYLGHGLSGWKSMAPVCKEHLGFDPTTWPRYKAAERFLRRIAQPNGDKRMALPMGDTHPGRNGPHEVDVPEGEVKQFKTEELAGFGVIFQNRPGTSQETYLAFKSGPNRGHYHGDQLSFHLCADAKPLAVDHHCSYRPRAGQEHMHNRVAFSTDTFPYANMDGYERLIAVKTSPTVDIAIGQVESDRLRKCEKLPPEKWHAEYPQLPFEKPLCYRRTIVMLKGGPRDYFVIRDQYWASQALNATWCLHAYADEAQRDGQTIRLGKLTVFCAAPKDFQFEAFPWEHSNGKHEATEGVRLTAKGPAGEFITVVYPGKPPAMSSLAHGVKVGDDEVNFAGDAPTAGDSIEHVVVKRGGKPTLALSGKDIDLERSQGDIGLFVPDAGYPFGEIPDWLIRQRAGREASEILMRGMKKTTTVTPRIIIQEEEEKKLGVQP